MFPGTTSSESVFFAPRRFPGPAAALLARPSEACDAWREGMKGYIEEMDRCREVRLRRQVVSVKHGSRSVLFGWTEAHIRG